MKWGPCRILTQSRFKELALVPCYRNRRPWIRMGSLALQELGLYPELVRSCLHARGLSAQCLCGRAYPRVQRGVAHSGGQLRRSRAHDSSVFVWLIGSFICRFPTVCRLGPGISNHKSACDYRESDRVQSAIVVGLRVNRKIAPILEIHWSVRGQGGTNRGQRTSS